MSFIVNGVGSVSGITPVLVFESLLPSEGGGTWAVEKFEQTSNFTSGLTLTLTNTPLQTQGVFCDYNGQKYYLGDDFTISGNTVTILFDDPYVTTYDEPPIFHFQYQY